MKYRNILFDLDGTLSDPYVGITNSIKYSLARFGIFEEDGDKLKLFIGPPLEESFAGQYRFDKANARKAVEYYREYFSEKGIYENTLYPGVENVLRELNASSRTCILATSKPGVFAKRILEYFHLHGYFKYIAGSNLDGTLVEKEDIIKHAIEKNEIPKRETIMAGDRKHDIIGAHRNGIHSIGVLYGYGSREELEKAKPTYLCAGVADILGIV
jgi:phosphoglycolate phosphatase